MNSKVKLNITGKNIDRFIRRIITANIEIIELNSISHKEINILIYERDFKKVKSIKSIYKIKIIDYKGLSLYKRVLKQNSLFIIFIFVGIFIVFFLSNIIFSIKVVHSDKNLQELILGELENYNIKIHKFKKSNKRINEIKNEILNKYKDEIEWLEIENYGTSYIVRVEERLIPKEKEIIKPRNIIAKKNAVISKIIVSSGVIERLVGEYVKKGDIIVSGAIKLNEEIKNLTSATGDVYGEVWYTVTVEYPYIYSETVYTGNKKKNLNIRFLNKRFNIIGKNYKDSKIVDKIKLNSLFLPISIAISEQYEVKEIDNIYNEEEALEMAQKRSKTQIESKLGKDEYIIDQKIIDTTFNENKVKLQIFYNVYENIGEYQTIEGE